MVARAIVEEAKKSGILRADVDQRATGLIAKVIEEAIRTAAETITDGLAADGLRRCNACKSWCHTDTAIIRKDLGVTYCDETCQRGARCVHCQAFPATEDFEPYCSPRCKENEDADRREADECRREDVGVA